MEDLILQLEALRDLALRPHYYCEEDHWYSCCAHPDCLNDWNNGRCSCGADRHNEKVNRIFDNIMSNVRTVVIKGQ